MPTQEEFYSTRDIEHLCKDSQRTQYLLNSSNIPNYSTITRFLSKTGDVIHELFSQFLEKLFELTEISTETIYIDGTKIEAYANKYSFVWKKSTLKYKERLEENILELIEKFNKYFNKDLDNIFEVFSYLENLSIQKIHGKGKRKKEDYMRKGQLKPGYNLQIGEYTASYEIFHNPSDTKTLIPFLEKIKSQNIEIQNVVADAGYESLPNYEYLENNNYVSYIKPIYYEKSKIRKYKKI